MGDGFLAVWRRDESTEQLLSGLVLSPAEQAYYDTIAGHPRRRKEWLTWHMMVREFLGEDVYTDYGPQGEPVLCGHPGAISVSHSADFVVLYYQPERCGVDIEDCGRRFDQAAARYITEEEWQLPGANGNNRFQALMWCLKETAYKYAGRSGLDLLHDIRVTRIVPEHSEALAEIAGRIILRMRYEFLHDHCLTYTLGEGLE